MDSREDYESRLQLAVDKIKDGAMTYRQAHDEYGVGIGTLHARVHGVVSLQQAHQSEQKLSPDLEESIMHWILHEECAHRAPTKAQVRCFAGELCKAAGLDTTVGKNWVPRFIARHPQLHTKVGVPLSAERANATEEERLASFFNALDDAITRYQVKTGNVINMDETGVSGRQIKRHKVLGTSETTISWLSEPHALNWTSILESITGDGRRLTPCMVLTGKTLQKQHFPFKPPGWRYIESENGWSTALICHKWLTEVFLPETTPRNRQEWRLLLLDGSSTHTSLSLMARAWYERVMVIYLPAHTSHISQPCDKGVFAPLKEFYSQETARTAFVPGTAAINKRLAIEAYKRASDKAFSRRNILSGFSHTGIMPFNPQRVLKTLPDAEVLQGENNEITRPATPSSQFGHVIQTPKRAEDLIAMANRIVDGQNALERDIRLLVRKAGKTLDQSVGEIATLREENKRLNTLVEELCPRKKQRIQRDPNRAFADVQKAMGSDPSPSQRRQRGSAKKAPDPQEISYTTLMHREEELQHQFRL